jgi:hypothetical protein
MGMESGRLHALLICFAALFFGGLCVAGIVAGSHLGVLLLPLVVVFVIACVFVIAPFGCL